MLQHFAQHLLALIAKLAKPETGKYLEEELGFLVCGTMEFVARNLAKVERDSTSEILHATVSGVDTRCELAIARNIVRSVSPCIRALI